MEISFPVEVIEGVPVVTAPEEVDISNATQLQQALLEAAGPEHLVVVVDESVRDEIADGVPPGDLPGRQQGVQAEIVHGQIGHADLQSSGSFGKDGERAGKLTGVLTEGDAILADLAEIPAARRTGESTDSMRASVGQR